jgi:hypothetical protein
MGSYLLKLCLNWQILELRSCNTVVILINLTDSDEIGCQCLDAAALLVA